MNLETLNKQIIKNCKIYPDAKNVVPGEGNPHAEILFIGEAPGRNEDEQGRPFVGMAGKLLSELLKSINLDREDVYITNIVKARPPKNRDPKPKEIEFCWPWLMKQIKIIKPKVIVTLGRHSMKQFLPEATITQAHGKKQTITLPMVGKVTLFPCYHPAAALYNGGLRKTLFDDIKKLKKLL